MKDQVSATEMAMRAYKKIKEIAPDHELTKIMEPSATDEDFINRFWDKEESRRNFPGSMVAMRVEINYFLAVKKFLKEKHGIDI